MKILVVFLVNNQSFCTSDAKIHDIKGMHPQKNKKNKKIIEPLDMAKVQIHFTYCTVRYIAYVSIKTKVEEHIY